MGLDWNPPSVERYDSHIQGESGEMTEKDWIDILHASCEVVAKLKAWRSFPEGAGGSPDSQRLTQTTTLLL